MAERAFTRALGGTCHSPVAALAIFDDGQLNFRAQIFSEDGSEMVEDKAIFDCEDEKTPIEMARRMLEKAPESIRSLFQPT
jgi:hydroxymethylbilane synthase